MFGQQPISPESAVLNTNQPTDQPTIPAQFSFTLTQNLQSLRPSSPHSREIQSNPHHTLAKVVCVLRFSIRRL